MYNDMTIDESSKYMTVNKDGNYIVKAKDLEGKWSKEQNDALAK